MHHTPWFQEGKYWLKQVGETAWLVATLGIYIARLVADHYQRRLS